MAKKLYIQASKPFIEVKLKPSDSSEKDVTFGLRLYGLKEKADIDKKFAGFIEDNEKYVAALAKMQDEELLATIPAEERATLMQDALNYVKLYEDYRINRLKEDILYVKDATISIFDEENMVTSLVIKDTRKVDPLADFWETSSEALTVILDSFLDNKQWKDTLLNKHEEVLSTDFKGEQVKN